MARGNKMSKILLGGLILLICMTSIDTVLGEPAVGPYDNSEEKWGINYKFAPTTVTDNDTWALGFDYEIGVKRKIWSDPCQRDRFQSSFKAHLNSEGTFVSRTDVNTIPITVDAKIGAAINLYKPPKEEPGDKPGTSKIIEPGSNAGRADFLIKGAYETDQEFENSNYTLGAEIAWVLNEHFGFKSLLPSVYLGYDLVRTHRSEIQDNLDLDETSSDRYRTFTTWKLPIGGWI